MFPQSPNPVPIVELTLSLGPSTVSVTVFCPSGISKSLIVIGRTPDSTGLAQGLLICISTVLLRTVL